MAYLAYGRQWLAGAYAWAYVLSQPVLWALYFLLILELYSLMLEEFPGIRRLGRMVLLSALGAITLVSCALIVLDHQAGFDPYPFLSYLTLQQRSIFLCLSALTLLLLLFTAHYRLPIARNVWILYASFGAFFLASAFLFTLRRYFGAGFASTRDLLGLVVYFAGLLGASLFVSRPGELQKRPISEIWGRRNRDLEAALSSQLQGFNQVLLKVLRQ